jgi:hypothetical protein
MSKTPSEFNNKYPPLEVGDYVVIAPYRWYKKGVVEAQVAIVVSSKGFNYSVYVLAEGRAIRVPRTKLKKAGAIDLLDI